MSEEIKNQEATIATSLIDTQEAANVASTIAAPPKDNENPEPIVDKEEEFEPLEEGETEVVLEETGAVSSAPVVEPVCNCGKKPGQKGPHKLTCPVRGSGLRPKTTSTASASSISLPGDTSQAPQQPGQDRLLTSGAIFDSATRSLGILFDAKEWEPESKEERDACVGAIANYMQANDCKDIPPGTLLLLVLGSYAAKRVTRPTTKEKLTVVYLKVRPFFVGLFNRVKGLFSRKTISGN
jgi:hypothetical protein